MAIGPKKMAGEGEAAGNRWRGGRETILLLAWRQFFWLAGCHFLRQLLAVRPFAAFLSNIRVQFIIKVERSKNLIMI